MYLLATIVIFPERKGGKNTAEVFVLKNICFPLKLLRLPDIDAFSAAVISANIGSISIPMLEFEWGELYAIVIALIMEIILWDVLMFYQIFLSPYVKWSAIISNKQGVYELPNDLRLRALGNKEKSGESPNLLQL